MKIDRTLASQHLEYLGYQPGDNTYLRFFYHAWDPRKNGDSGRKESTLNWEQIESYQADGRGVYVVVNGDKGGHTDADISQCCAIFCEWDDIPLAEQFEKWSSIGFVEPTFTVFSGDKSMQPYWVFDEPIAPEQWRELQQLLIEVMKADRSNKNPSRVFRLAGGWHVKPDREPAKTEIVGDSGIRYNFMDLQSRLVNLLVADTSRTIIENQLSTPTPTSAPTSISTPTSEPTPMQEPQSYKDITVPVPIAISLECALGKAKEFLGGVTTLRNTSMATLARDLIGTAAEFQHLGQMTNDDAYTLFIDACRRCSPGGGWGEGEWEQIWASAVRSNPSSSIAHKISRDAVENCIKGEYWNSIKVSIGQAVAHVHTESAHASVPSARAIHELPLETEIDELLTRNLKESQLQIKILGIAQKYRISSKEILKVYELRESEKEQEESAEDTANEVAKLLASKSGSLNMSEILPETLAAPIERLATTLNLKPEGYLLALMVQCGSLLPANTSTMLFPQTQFSCNPNYFGVSVGESSQKKTPVLNAIISAPMEKLLIASEQEYKTASIAYEEVLNQWKNSKDTDKGAMPVAPAQKVYSFNKATGEGIAAQAQKLPHQSMLYLCDELAGAFKSANQYRGGKGSDEEDLLEYWSGGGAVVLRVGGLATNVRHVGLSIFGNIQPKVLAGFLGDGEDNNGKFARFDFVQQPLAATELAEDAPSIDLTPMLTAIYEKLDALPEKRFELDRTARKLFIRFYNHCENQRISHPKQGMRAMWGKAPLKVGKIATILHCLHAAHLGLEVSPKIQIETIRSAIKFVKFTIDQALSLNLELCESVELAPNLAKIITLADRKKEPICVREIRQSFNSKYRPPTGLIREWFGQLVAMGYGIVDAIRGTFSLERPQRPQRPQKGYEPCQEPVENVHTNVHTNVHNVHTNVHHGPYHPTALTALTASTASTDPVVAPQPDVDVDQESGRESGRLCGRSKAIQDKDFDENVDVVDVVDVVDEEVAELVSFIRTALAEGDREFAQNIQGILREACKSDGADRFQVWAALSESEQVAFTTLITPEIEAPLIEPIDAETIRDIAQLWDEYYPEHTQNLITQMFGWQSPGQKYSQEIINQWLETEDELVSDRITQLFAIRNSSKTEETP